MCRKIILLAHQHASQLLQCKVETTFVAGTQTVMFPLDVTLGKIVWYSNGQILNNH